jgi:hypothetical protein
MKIKPGYKTSEFWFTLVSFLFSGLYLLGIISDMTQKEDLIRDVSHGVESIILISGQLAILWKYINSRKEIKQTWKDSVESTEITPDTVESINKTEPKPKRSKNANSKRNNSSRSRKTNNSSKKLAE